MAIREQLIEDMTPEAVIESAEAAIQKNKLTGEQWGQEHWVNVSTQAWIERLAANPEILQKVLSQRIQITATKQQAWADWIDFLNQYMYFESKESAEHRSIDDLARPTVA